jgi:hypothetical protein
LIHADKLLYWIKERYAILAMKEAGAAPPWTEDEVLQTVYFCNVRREDDKVTKYIREFYREFWDHPNLIYNYVFARFVNWPQTIACCGFMDTHEPERLKENLELARQTQVKVWGGAYVITTHGIPMAKAAYMVDHTLDAVHKGLGRPELGGPHPALPPTLKGLHGLLMQFEGLGSFLAAQIVADVKNTKGHDLHENAEDWWTFVAHGPGSIRGASWVHYGEIGKVTPASFASHFNEIRDYVDEHWPASVPIICNQDLQNCLCEFDKYMRVSTGSGRSKRNYDGFNPRTQRPRSIH